MFKKSTAQKTPEVPPSVPLVHEPIRVDGTPPIKDESMCQEAQAAATAKKCREEIEPILANMDVKNEVKRIEKIINASTAIDMNKQRHLVKVVCNPNIIDSLKTDDIPYLGKMQRQIAKAFVNADENGKKLEVWLKKVDKHEQETITPTMPAVVPSAEELQEQQLVQDSEECASTPTHMGKWPPDANPTIAQPMEEKKATAGHLEELIIARVWKNFKEINPTCKEERGSEFFHSWKQDLLASDP